LKDENTRLGLSLLLTRAKTACANKAADFIAQFIRAYDPPLRTGGLPLDPARGVWGAL